MAFFIWIPHSFLTEDSISPVSIHHCPAHSFQMAPFKCLRWVNSLSMCCMWIITTEMEVFGFSFRWRCIYFLFSSWFPINRVRRIVHLLCIMLTSELDVPVKRWAQSYERCSKPNTSQDISCVYFSFHAGHSKFPFSFLPELLHDVATTNKDFMGNICLNAVVTMRLKE